jgi:hypothetical protein
MLTVISSCTKENKDSLVSNSINTALQKWNPDEGYPFVLPNDMQPYQYAVYQEDLDNLLYYTISILKEEKEGEKSGYFIFSSNNIADGLIYYGFIAESSHYYDPNIFVDNPDDPFINIDEDNEDNLCYGKIVTRNEKRFDRWLDRQMRKGNDIVIEYDKATGVWKGTSNKPDRWKDPFQ